MAKTPKVSFEISEEADLFIDKIIKNFKKVQDRHQDFAMAVSPLVYRDIIKHFEEERGPQGAWPEWSESYKAAIRGEVFFRTVGKGRVIAIEGPDPKGVRQPGQKLQDTGHLRQGVQPMNFRSSTQGFDFFNPALTSDGFPYAAAHDEGGPKLPARTFMWLSTEALEQIAKIALKFVQDDQEEN